jgi:CBS domain containing-hemolysin-like protein
LTTHPAEKDIPIETALGLGAVVALILATSFFVAVEFALVAVDRDRVEAAAAEGDRRAQLTAIELRRLSFHLSAAQLGITITSLVLGFVAEPTVASVIDGVVPSHALSVVLALVIVTVATMVFGELIPKGLAIAAPLRVVRRLVRAMRLYGLVFGPLIRLLNGAADWAVRRVGIEPREELRSVRTMEELELLIRSSGEEGTLEAEAFELLTRTIRFAHKTAADALVPRVDMKVVQDDSTVADLVAASVETGHSRFPVVAGDPDDIVGIVDVKDALRVQPSERPTTPVTSLTTDALVVPEGLDLESLLTQLRDRAQQMAIVLDEHGGVAGMVSLEDLVEEIVGDIEDEHDHPDLPRMPDVVEGTIHLDDLFEATGLRLPDGEYETLAGFVHDRLGRIAREGDVVEHEGWVIQVVAMDRRRIDSVRLMAPVAADEPDGTL